jgi:hypothetical protein
MSVTRWCLAVLLASAAVMVSGAADADVKESRAVKRLLDLLLAARDEPTPCDGGRRSYRLSERCDFEQACDDGADELGCLGDPACGGGPRSVFVCGDSTQCTPALMKCNGYEECLNGADEEGCSTDDLKQNYRLRMREYRELLELRNRVKRCQ